MEFILENSINRDKDKEKGSFSGIMDKFMKENGFKEKSMEKVLG